MLCPRARRLRRQYPVRNAVQPRPPPRGQRRAHGLRVQRLIHGRAQRQAALYGRRDRRMDDQPIVRLVRRLLQRVQRADAEDMLGIDRIRVLLPGLHLTHTQPARALCHRRPWFGRRDRHRRTTGLIEQRRPRRRRVRRQRLLLPILPLPGQVGVDPHQPARRHGRGAVPAPRARQHHKRCRRHQHREIMGRLPDAFLRRRQPTGGAHRPAHPWAGIGRGGPYPFRQAAQHDQIGREQPRLQQAQDCDPGMLCPVQSAQRPARPYHGPGQCGVQQARQRVKRLRRQDWQRIQQSSQVGGERVAFLARPQPVRARGSVRFCQPLRRIQQRPQRIGRGRLLRARQQEQAVHPCAELIQDRHVRARPRRRRAQPIQARSRRRAAQAVLFQPPRRRPACASGHAQPGQRVLQHRQQRHRSKPLRHGARQQAQECCRRRVCQWLAGAVISHDAITPQLRRNSPGQRPVGRDQHGTGAGCLQRVAQHERDGHRLLLFVGGV